MKRNSEYLKYLPQIYQEGESAFLVEFLSLFSKVITEMKDPITDTAPGSVPDEAIEQIVDRLHEFFDPMVAPGGLNNPDTRNFLNYLADWVSLVEKHKIEDERKRFIVKNLIPLYKERGTKGGLKRFIELFTGFNTVIIYDTPEEKAEFAIKLKNPLNENILLNNYTFGVLVDISAADGVIKYSNVTTMQELIQLINRLIQREKPAHTDAVVALNYKNGMQIGVICTISCDTTTGSGSKIAESVNGLLMQQ